MWKCNFCNLPNKIEMYISECNNCKVAFFIIDPKENNEWDLRAITYFKLNPIFHSLEIDITRNRAILWYNPAGPVMKKVVIPNFSVLVKPEEAVNLADKLSRMKIFL